MPPIEHRLPADYRAASLRADALGGLTATPKSLPPKWFYDAQGSALFEKITELPEYYPTRAERATCRAGARGGCLPGEVSESALAAAGDALSAESPGLAVHAVVADFEKYLGVPSVTG